MEDPQRRHDFVLLVRGSGDVASAIAYQLFTAGYGVVVHDDPLPTVTRRGMAFTDAIFHGRTTLAGVTAHYAAMLPTRVSIFTAPRTILLVTAPFPHTLTGLQPDVMVDARMRKRALPEAQRGQAPLTIGVRPNFHAGITTDLAVETQWGPALGQVLTTGATQALAGEPHPLAGVGRARYVYAPVAGRWTTAHAIGALVQAAEIVAWIDDTPVPAPLTGVLRGLTHTGVPVTAGVKVLEVDPRGPQAVVIGIGERPGRIAAGVLRAVQAWEHEGAAAP